MNEKQFTDAFYIGKYEVTNAQYKRFVEATGYPPPPYWSDELYNVPDKPVVGVSYFDVDFTSNKMNTEQP